jgi:hypothetical protein
VIIDRDSILAYWLSEPVRGYHADGWIDLSSVPFPDLIECSFAERCMLKPVLVKHPEYLLEIFCGRSVR